MDIIGLAKSRAIDYAALREKCIFRGAQLMSVDISIIIPVSGRLQFNHTISEHFHKAILESDQKISVTFVEHSPTPEHLPLCYDWVNYIWIPREAGVFNKCLAHNMGAIYSPISKFYLFHDVDIIVPSNFFNLINKNLGNNQALQTFRKRRLRECDKDLTARIINGTASFDNIDFVSPGVRYSVPGASGGSIFVTRDLFTQVGGYDPEFFSEYSIEDQFFFDKLNILGKFGFCDDPQIELAHLYHEPSFSRITKGCDWDAFDSFHGLTVDEQKYYMKQQCDHLKQYLPICQIHE